MAGESSTEYERTLEAAVSCRSLTALSAPIIYLVESQLCVKMQLLIASHNQCLSATLELH